MIYSIELLQRHPWLYNAIASLLLVFIVLVLRQILVHWIRRSSIQSMDLRRRWIVQTRNVCFLLVLIGLVIIWASELHTVALSLAAFMVAFVLATKELILCLSGSFLKVSSGSFSIGDRIEVNTLRGDVIDQTLLATRIMEVGPGPHSHMYTGKTIVVPNSIFLTDPVINYSITPKFVLHMFLLPLKAEENWQQAEEDLLAAANEVCQGFIEEARLTISRMISREGLEISTIDPRITISIPEPELINLNIRVPLPGDQVGRNEQEIIRRFLARRIERTPPTVPDTQ
ncbi:MAG: small-conductance mechanosensitive channel [Candidatus Latescibacterota bacterium]|jgi:small-conductance mechanosensitive channel